MLNTETYPLVRPLLVVLLLIASLHLVQQIWSMAAGLADVIFLFFLAWLVGFVLSPLANLICRTGRIPRPVAVGLVYLGLVLVLILAGLLVVPAVIAQLSQISESLPTYLDEAPAMIAALQTALDERQIGVQLASIYGPADLTTRIEALVSAALQNVLGLVTGLASVLFGTIIVLVLSFYFVLDGGRIANSALRLLPQDYADDGQALLQSIDRSFGGFLRAQMIQAIILSVGTAILMIIAGLDYVLLSSVYVAVVIIIPFIGPFLALVAPLLVGIFQLSVPEFILFVVALLVLQQIVFNIIAPKLLGDATGMHPLLVFVALLTGIKVAGLAGAIFGIPVMAVLNAMIPVFYRRSVSQPVQLDVCDTAPSPASEVHGTATLADAGNGDARPALGIPQRTLKPE